MAVGVFHGTVFEKITNLLIELGVSRGIVVQGMEGSEDLSVDKRTRTYLIQEGSSELFIVTLRFMNLMVEVPEVEWTARTARRNRLIRSSRRCRASLLEYGFTQQCCASVGFPESRLH